MILDMLLNESNFSTANISVPEPLNESFYTGDENGMSEICLETQQDMCKLDEAVMLCEQLAKACEIKGQYNKAIMLQEGSMKDFFTKVRDKLEEMWEKVKTLFKNLFKNIEVGVRDITKIIEKYKDELNKDFSDYEYRGYEWKKLESQKYSDNAKTLIDNLSKGIDTEIAKRVKLFSNEKNIDAFNTKKKEQFEEKHNKIKEEYTADRFRNEIVNGSDGELDSIDAKEIIVSSYRGDSQETIKNFSDASCSEMVTFIKNFKNNKVLTDLQRKTDDLFKKAIQAADKAKKSVDSVVSKAESKSNKALFGGNHSAMLKITSGALTTAMNTYDAIMGICISLEKERFNEYKKVIAGAIRYKSKEN